MSDETNSTKHIATAVGAGAGGLIAGGIAYNQAANNFVVDVLDESSPLHVVEAQSAEVGASVHDAVNAKSKMLKKEVAGIQNSARYKEVEADYIEKFAKSDAYAKAVTKANGAMKGVEYLGKPESLSKVQFKNQSNGIYDISVALNENGLANFTKETAEECGMRQIEVDAASGKLTRGSFLIKNVEKHPKLADCAEVGSIYTVPKDSLTSIHESWFGGAFDASQAAKSTLKTVEADIGVQSKILRKASPLGWSLKHMPDEKLASIAGATIIGAVAGAYLLRSLFGGKHAQHVAAQKQQAASAEPSIFS
jgi:hypothetical protein